MRRRKSKTDAEKDRRLSPRQQEARVRGLAALNRVRRGKSKSVSLAARAEGTTVRSIRKLLPAALIQDSGRRIRVKASDPYSAKVEIMTDSVALEVVKARGSRERERAGRHRVTVMRVLRGELPPSALEEFRGKTVGGKHLVVDFEQVSNFGQAGLVDQLDNLYVAPATSR
jgi:hypothetical protein